MAVELLVGMIASGKTTYARKRADEGALVVSHDDLTQMLHARYRYEPGLRDLYRRMEEELVRVAVAKMRSVVIDRTHLTRESRKRWVEFATDLRVPAIAIVFPVEPAEVHARRRFETDPRGRPHDEWLDVAKHHAEQARFEPLRVDEGFKKILTYDFATESLTPFAAMPPRVLRA